MATSRCRGNWKQNFFSGWASFQLIILLLVEEAGSGYWRRLAVSVTKRNTAEARLQGSLMQSKECVLDCLGFVELLILSWRELAQLEAVHGNGL